MRTRIGWLAAIVGSAILVTSWWLVDSGRVVISAPKPQVAVSATPSLSPCPKTLGDMRVPLQPEWAQVVSDYYAAKGLAVVSIEPQAWLRNLEQQSLGWHRCLNPGGVEGGWQGAVPLGSIAAVMLYVVHDPYPEPTPFTDSFVTLASSGAGWSVVAGATSP